MPHFPRNNERKLTIDQ
jgi:hypothetical protein